MTRTSVRASPFQTKRWTGCPQYGGASGAPRSQEPGTTLLRVEETGYSGDPETVIAAALDSTGGFNQVIIAAKAWLEHRAPINVVADHAERS